MSSTRPARNDRPVYIGPRRFREERGHVGIGVPGCLLGSLEQLDALDVLDALGVLDTLAVLGEYLESY